MTSFSADSNTWYSISSSASDYNLGTVLGALELHSNSQLWQFLDVNVAAGGFPSGQYLMRNKDAGIASCVSITGNSPGLECCSSTSNLWELVNEIASDGSSILTIQNKPEGFLASPDSDGLAYIAHSMPQSGFDNLAWALKPVSAIDNHDYSRLPWERSTIATSTSTMPAGNSAEVVLAARQAATTTSVSSAASPSNTFSLSIIDKDVKDFGPIISNDLPKDVDFGCRNCSTSGSWDIATIGYTHHDSDFSTIASFFDSGIVQITISQFLAEMSVDLEMEPGFQFINKVVTLPILDQSKTIDISDHLQFKFTLEMGIPISLTLDTPVTFSSGFTLDVPQIQLNIDFGHLENSNLTGLSGVNFQALPFNMSAPNLALTGNTGLIVLFKLNAIATVDDIKVTGGLAFDINVPSLNLTAQVESSPVNASCDTPQPDEPTYSPAVNFMFDVEASIVADGNLNIVFENHTFPIAGDNDVIWHDQYNFPNQCLFEHRLQDTFLAVASKTSASLKSTPTSTPTSMAISKRLNWKAMMASLIGLVLASCTI